MPRYHLKHSAKKAKSARKRSHARSSATGEIMISDRLKRELARAGEGSGLVIVKGKPGAALRTNAIGRIVVERRDGRRRLQIEPIEDEAELEAAEEAAYEAFEPDARARALLRGREIAEEDLREAGGAYSMDEVRALLGHVSRQTVHKKLASGELLSVVGPGKRRMFPTIQFTREGPTPGLREVSAAFPSKNPWALLNFLMTPDDRLAGRKPIDALRAGETERVVKAAASLGHAGA